MKATLKIMASSLAAITLIVLFFVAYKCNSICCSSIRVGSDLKEIEVALKVYWLDNGFYPSTEQGLQALVLAPTTDPKPIKYQTVGYLSQIPIDPWGVEYKYALAKGGAVIWTSGSGEEEDTKLLREVSYTHKLEYPK